MNVDWEIFNSRFYQDHVSINPPPKSERNNMIFLSLEFLVTISSNFETSSTLTWDFNVFLPFSNAKLQLDQWNPVQLLSLANDEISQLSTNQDQPPFLNPLPIYLELHSWLECQQQICLCCRCVSNRDLDHPQFLLSRYRLAQNFLCTFSLFIFDPNAHLQHTCELNIKGQVWVNSPKSFSKRSSIEFHTIIWFVYLNWHQIIASWWQQQINCSRNLDLNFLHNEL